MKKTSILCMLLLLLPFAGSVNAALIDRGAGLIYDDVLDVTWLQDASYAMTSGVAPYARMSWLDAVSWVDGLQYEDSVRGVVWDDWRLPTTINDPASLGYDTAGLSSELAYMYYINLGYAPNYSHNRFDPVPESSNNNPFINLAYRGYWSGTLSDFSDQAWYLHFHFGSQEINSIWDEQRIWAVRDGDVLTETEQQPNVNVPEPSVLLLMMTGLLAIVGRRKSMLKQ
ncbi:MAG: DUF1566 domain-containing protein [Candidatus Thiodiazotropha endolucinida]|nr:DUF1566 domain-containing protein [Candidatus Thiodiazotropha taylori]MCG8092025.1 DUF1566 domain-containing protein [Candidatus Thiodiazotropha endolucinida]MCG8058993.1 DUF1566 domain-containing protein [Candidatus Thiodiazotropha taylori]MCG8062605.1 DUF1566 domain-containing protein [Candidatus Thiodiazotropha taylori]MCW4328682.1 DUF1566 domain-containing protein [Candidatus Thiodiazotropha endolucinida]